MNTGETEQLSHGLDAGKADPFNTSLFGEYLRLALIGTVSLCAAFWASQLGVESFAATLVAVCIVSLGALVSSRYAGLVRLAVLLLLIVVVVLAVGMTGNWLGPILFLSPAAVTCCISLLALRDVAIVVLRNVRRVSCSKIGVGLAVAVALIWVIVFPIVENYLQQFEERPAGFVVEEVNLPQVFGIRTAKLAVFAIFAYLGACIGSFLNVVAASAPRGESITTRSSTCPNCDVPIRRIDNLPIISYLALRGRCRSCQSPIPSRYLIVELVTAAIFASLFLFELVTGATNVPGARLYHAAGILWIILYTKWPVVGIYFYHTMMFSCLLMFVLIEADRLRCPRIFSSAIIGTFVLLGVLFSVLQPVTLDDQLPFAFSERFPPWVARTATCLAGGLTGWFVAAIANHAGATSFAESKGNLAISFVLLGVTLGWQATMTIAVVWAILWLVLGHLPRPHRLDWLRPTGLLFAVAMLHHPAWRTLAQLW